MFSLRTTVVTIAAFFLLLSIPLAAQTPTLKQQLESKYAVTKATANRDDIVTAGDVIVLQKDNLLMCATTGTCPTRNTYSNGKIQQDMAGKLIGGSSWMKKIPGASTSSITSRTYVSGEKFWITGIDVKDDGVVFTVMSDPVGDNRFYGTVKFPFPKGSPPPADQMLATVGEVFKVQPSGDSNATGGDSKQSGPPKQATATPPAPPMAAIPPPPPPADVPPAAPPTIAMGQTKDQVIAMFGNPTRILDKGATKVFVYPDMKVTFVKDKVTNIQ